MLPHPPVWALVGSALLLVAGRAGADVAPPPDYVESCTVARVARPGLECRSCSAWHGDPDACTKELGAEGYRHNCRAGGASAWEEVWCRPVRALPPAPPATSPRPTDPSAFGAPPVATLAVSPSGARDPVAASPGPSEDPTTIEGPTPPPPGARGCGGCALAAPRSTAALLAGLALTTGALLGGAGLRRSKRRRCS